ncbi:MAG: hypothetical protein WBV82_09490 [Myxococcaceae bacterium]
MPSKTGLSKPWTPDTSTRSESSRSESSRSGSSRKIAERTEQPESSAPPKRSRQEKLDRFLNFVDKVEKVTGVLGSALGAVSAASDLAETIRPRRQTQNHTGYADANANHHANTYANGWGQQTGGGGGYVYPSYDYSQPNDYQYRDLSTAKDATFNWAQMKPEVTKYAKAHGVDPHLLAAVMLQESGIDQKNPTWKNWKVHHDGTGHGLIGLDDAGKLPEFEKWLHDSNKVDYLPKLKNADAIKPEWQIEYLAKELATSQKKYGQMGAAILWHTGNPKAMEPTDPSKDNWKLSKQKKAAKDYTGYIQQHMATLKKQP